MAFAFSTRKMEFFLKVSVGSSKHDQNKDKALNLKEFTTLVSDLNKDSRGINYKIDESKIKDAFDAMDAADGNKDGKIEIGMKTFFDFIKNTPSLNGLFADEGKTIVRAFDGRSSTDWEDYKPGEGNDFADNNTWQVSEIRKQA